MEQFSYIKNELKKMSFEKILRDFKKCNQNFKILYIKLKKKNRRLKKRYIITII